MSTPRRTKTALLEPEIPPDYVPEDARLTAFLEEHGASEDGVVRVYREGPGGFRDQVLEQTYALNEFDPGKLLMPPFNGGKFRIYVTIDGATKHFPLNVRVLPPASSAPLAAADPNAGFAAVIAGMMKGFETLAAKIDAGAPRGMDVEQIIRLFALLREGQPAAAPVDPLALVGRIIQLQKDLTPATLPLDADGDVGGGALIMQAIKTFGEPLAEIIKRGSGQGAGQGAGQVPGAVPQLAHAPATMLIQKPLAAVVPIQPSQPPQPEPEDDMGLKIRLIKPVLLAMARSGVDVTPYVDLMLDTFTDEELAKYITGDDWQARLVELVPEAAELMPWFTQLREGVLEALDHAANEDAPPEALVPRVDGVNKSA